MCRKIDCVRKIVASGINFRTLHCQRENIHVWTERKLLLHKRETNKISAECKLVIRGQECICGT
jgi:tmRNA-binding protein